jgi:penicillin-binding protein 2
MRIYEDLRVVQARIGVLQYMALSCVAFLLVTFWYIQVLHVRYYRTLAENNRSRVVPIAAPRGPLLDRGGHTLVENRPSFNIVMTLDHDPNPNLDETIVRLGRVLRLGEGQIRERLARRQPLRPVVVKADATLEDVAALEARRLELPEAQVEVVPLRSYPLAAAAAHILGRVGEVTERQLQQPEYANLEAGDLVGQAGIESAYNRALMGRDGLRRVIVNSRGVEVAEAERKAPRGGPSLTLTLDAELQKAMERAFAGRAGSAIALDPATGEILAMTSTPAYDPNQFTTGLDAAVWSRLSTDPANPLMNRVIQGQYAPGSLFKVVMAVAALEEGVITPETSFYCPGYLSIYNTVFRCHKAAGHGVMDVRRAIAQSCNVFFYQLGVRLEIERIARHAKRLGLGAVTGVDLPHEASGLIPSPEWKLGAFKTPWYAGETVSVAIGQGQVTVTPLQMARVAAAIANGGRLVQPHLVKALGTTPLPACETPSKDDDPPCWLPARDLGLRPTTLSVVRDGMRAVVDGGTGWRARLPGVAICGKTGSAQVVAHARLVRSGGSENLQPHGWFIAFAPADKPRIALAVLVEHGGSGGEAAAPVAHEILAQFFLVGPPAPATVQDGGKDTEG